MSRASFATPHASIFRIFVLPNFAGLRALATNGSALFAIVVVTLATLAGIARNPDAALVKSDFAAFYCGAAVTLAHGDPYALVPLRDCETTRVDLPGGADPAAVGIDPAPLPGYVMAVFAPFTALPYRTAALLWDAALVAAIAGTVVVIVALTKLPWPVVAAIVAYADGALSIPYGQLPPIFTLGIVLAGYGLARERHSFTLMGAALAMIEPHVGVATSLALFIWRPALRPALAGLAVVLAVSSVAFAGVPLTLEYFRIELPAHAMAESTTAIQYSLAWLLHYAGVGDATAIRFASAQYALTMLLGIALAPVVARKLHAPAAIALFPPVMAMIGGPFLHVQQLAAALPFALLAATRLRGGAARCAWLAVALLAVPWPLPTSSIAVQAVPIVIAIALIALGAQRPRFAAAGALLAVAIYAVVAGPVMMRVVPAVPRVALLPAPPMPRTLGGDRLASEEDAFEVRRAALTGFAISTPRTLASKIPDWLALCMMVAAAFAGAAPPAGAGARGSAAA